MSNIFPANGGPRQGTPFGMPNLNAGMGGGDVTSQIMAARQAEREDERNYVAQQQLVQNGLATGQRALPQIAGQVAGTPKNVVFDPSGQITPFQRETLDLRKQELGLRGGIAGGKQNIAERRAQLAELIQTGRATDAEKHEFRMTEIGERGDIRSNEIDQQGQIRSRQIGEQGNIGNQQIDRRNEDDLEMQRLRGTQSLNDIAARTAGEMRVNAAKPIDGQLPTQNRVAEANATRELMNTRPDLAKFITIDNNGNPSIKPPSVPGKYWGNTVGPTKQQFDEINKILYPPEPEPVKFPTTSNQIFESLRKQYPDTGTPAINPNKVANPAVSDPLGIRGLIR